MPLKCISDQGPEFGQEFTNMLKQYGIYHATSTSCNPQGNSIKKQIHQAVGNVLRVEVNQVIPTTMHEAKLVIQRDLVRVMNACNCACNGTIGGLSAGILAFHRDIYLDIPLIADILTLQ